MPSSIPNTSDQLKWLERIATLMDKAFKIPGTNVRVGLDPIIGLVPVVGDLVSFGISTLLLYAAFANGASGKVIMKMLFNIALDASVGSVPVLGNLFDFAFKANSRNYAILQEHWLDGKHQGSGGKYIIAGMFILVALLLIVGLVSWKIVSFLLGLF